MVQATLEDRKNQTRRTQGLEEINNHPDDFVLQSTFSIGDDVNVKDKKAVGFHAVFKHSQGHVKSVKAKYATGDIIWVRETFQKLTSIKHKEVDFLYRGDVEFHNYFNSDLVLWTPSIHMPKEAARIFLEVTNVRCERVRDISEEDARNEGCGKIITEKYGDPGWYINHLNDHHMFNAVDSFASLWVKINGKGSWKLNPWVWVYEFKKIEKPAVWPS